MKRALAASWRWLLVAAIVALAPAPLLAQMTPYSGADIPLVPGTSRDPQAEAQLRAVPDSAARWVRAYRIGASIEALYKWYLNRLGGEPDDDTDTTPPRRAGLTNIKYRVGFHTFDDECVDPAGPATTGVTCRTLRQGKTKRNALSNVRIPYEKDHWIDSVTFTWFRRDTTGALVRLQVLIRDIGLAPDWKHYTPVGRLVLVSDIVEPGRPGTTTTP
jgi:hypothetical protein